MNKTFKLHKGLDIPLKGVAADNIVDATKNVGVVAVCPPDFIGFVPRVVVKEGDAVEVGTPLFVDKRNEAQVITSPVSGKVVSVDRGERRKLLGVKIESDDKFTTLDFGKTISDIIETKSDIVETKTVIDLINKSGISAYIRQRPYDIVPNTNEAPRDIFISLFNSMPLAADCNIVLRGREENFKAGVKALAKIAPVHVGIAENQIEKFGNIDGAEVNVFVGPNPAGNVGVQINNVKPINKGETVWTISPEMVAVLGKLISTGKLDFTRRIAVAGAEVSTPQYYDTIAGVNLKYLLAGKLNKTEHVRIINGNPLVGVKSSVDGFLSAFATEVTAIPEGDDVDELLGWISPRVKEYSVSRSYLSWLFPKRKYNIDARIKGGERHIIMSGEYDRVFPMDIYAGYLVKAIIARDIDKMEELGIYEVAPEDFAVAEFVDSSKLELQKIVREGLDYLRKELA